MTMIQAHIPDDLYQRVETLAKRENISMDALVSMALSGHLSALLAQQHIEHKAQKGNWGDVQKILAKVPDIEPEAYDRLDS